MYSWIHKQTDEFKAYDIEIGFGNANCDWSVKEMRSC